MEYAKKHLSNPSERHLGTLRIFLVSDRSGLFGVYRNNNKVKRGFFFVFLLSIKRYVHSISNSNSFSDKTPGYFFSSGHSSETATTSHVSTYFR